ncbi:hypothetical protein RUND412_010504 [Rhizina undulata]
MFKTEDLLFYLVLFLFLKVFRDVFLISLDIYKSARLHVLNWLSYPLQEKAKVKRKKRRSPGSKNSGNNSVEKRFPDTDTMGANERTTHKEVSAERKHVVEKEDAGEREIVADEAKAEFGERTLKEERPKHISPSLSENQNVSSSDEEVPNDSNTVNLLRSGEPITFGRGRNNRNLANETETYPRLDMTAEEPGKSIRTRVPGLGESSGTRRVEIESDQVKVRKSIVKDMPDVDPALSAYNPNWVWGYDRMREIRERWLQVFETSNRERKEVERAKAETAQKEAKIGREIKKERGEGLGGSGGGEGRKKLRLGGRGF